MFKKIDSIKLRMSWETGIAWTSEMVMLDWLLLLGCSGTLGIVVGLFWYTGYCCWVVLVHWVLLLGCSGTLGIAVGLFWYTGHCCWVVLAHFVHTNTNLTVQHFQKAGSASTEGTCYCSEIFCLMAFWFRASVHRCESRETEGNDKWLELCQQL